MSLTRITHEAAPVPTLPTAITIAVTWYAAGLEVAATVTRLCKRHFEVSVPAFLGRAPEVKKLAYSGMPTGARRISQAHERRYGLTTPPGLNHTDLDTIRKAAGRA